MLTKEAAAALMLTHAELYYGKVHWGFSVYNLFRNINGAVYRPNNYGRLFDC